MNKHIRVIWSHHCLHSQFYSVHNALSPKHPNKKIVYLHEETEHRETVTVKSAL